MLYFPGGLSPRTFLGTHWQKKPLFLANALDRVKPSMTRNELAWLATQDDVESRIVFVDRSKSPTHYRVQTGPFEIEFLQTLPKRDWTLLVHDVEKHLPAMRQLFQCIPFIPDGRIDDLMVSFAAPGGGVGPHLDHYDVFLCQGIGQRRWRYSSEVIPADNEASHDIALLQEFSGADQHDAVAGDVLYLPPLVAHWGTATRACMTYSIGMRAPQASDFAASEASGDPAAAAFYQDPDLDADEAQPGLISTSAIQRAKCLAPGTTSELVARQLGCCVTQTKSWLTPDQIVDAECDVFLQSAGRLSLNGMTRIAFDETNVYLNGRCRVLPVSVREVVSRLCINRALSRLDVSLLRAGEDSAGWLHWLVQNGAFDQSRGF